MPLYAAGSAVFIAAIAMTAVTAVAEVHDPGAASAEPRPAKTSVGAIRWDDLNVPVRPGGVNGQPFWNANSLWFMYPPVGSRGRS